jgi:glycerol-3-phosphate O-acyltransferase
MDSRSTEEIRSEVVGRVYDRTLARAEASGPPSLAEIVNETAWHEGERIRRSRSVSDGDRAFVAHLRRSIPKANDQVLKQLLRESMDRYAGEISGRFTPAVYSLATRAIPLGLNALLGGLSVRRVLGASLKDLATLSSHLEIRGETDALQRLKRHGTLVYAPTHSSNLDSVLLGYGIYRLGLPPVTYGAGLNLFSNPITGFFMRNLGAYTVDRLKTDPLYRALLKEYAAVTLEYGRDNLYFPGGTRGRSGEVERRLKMGLLGTAVHAYRQNLVRGRSNPRIYVVPVTLSYPLVLEASTLIEDHLKEAGKARYIIMDDEFSKLRRWFEYLKGLASLEQRIHLTVGPALDPFGNRVDEEGRSLDPRGRVVDPAGYLMADGEIVSDPVRDREYTKLLGARIIETWRTHNVAMATHALAFALFELLRRREPSGDLYRLLRTLGPEEGVDQGEVEALLAALLVELKERARRGGILLGRSVETGRAQEVMREGLRTFGSYHVRPVVERRGVRLHVQEPNLLFYYRNRLEGYGLLGAPDLLAAGGRS